MELQLPLAHAEIAPVTRPEIYALPYTTQHSHSRHHSPNPSERPCDSPSSPHCLSLSLRTTASVSLSVPPYQETDPLLGELLPSPPLLEVSSSTSSMDVLDSIASLL